MLPAANRLRKPADFADVIRHGRRAGAGAVVVHALGPTEQTSMPPRVGFVVSRAVGGAVARNTLRRRLRHLVRTQVVVDRPIDNPRHRSADDDSSPCPQSGGLSPGVRVVVRALPAAATRPSSRLRADLERALARALGSPG